MKYKIRNSIYKFLSIFVTRIRSGPLRGSRWTLFSGIRFVRGDFEPEKTAIIMRTLRAGDIFWDVGANMGYFSLLGSKIVGGNGVVIAIEPSSVNLTFLNKNIRINNIENVTVLAIAAAEAEGTVKLNTQSGRGTHHVDELGDTVVQASSIDKLIQEGYPPPNMVKIDVEGYEKHVIEGMKNCLHVYRPKLLVAVHSASLESAVLALVREFNYQLNHRIAIAKGDVELFLEPALLQ